MCLSSSCSFKRADGLSIRKVYVHKSTAEGCNILVSRGLFTANTTGIGAPTNGVSIILPSVTARVLIGIHKKRQLHNLRTQGR